MLELLYIGTELLIMVTACDTRVHRRGWQRRAGKPRSWPCWVGSLVVGVGRPRSLVPQGVGRKGECAHIVQPDTRPDLLPGADTN